MNLWELLIIAVGLSLDAFAVSVASGFSIKLLRRRDALKMAFFFGAFQAIMPALGWLAGISFRHHIEGFDHWVAFGLLAFIGGKMIYEAFALEKEEKLTDPPCTSLLLVLALATSLDALAVGLSLAVLRSEIVVPALVIGLVTFVICLVGVYLGHRFGHFFESKVEAVGGLILIGIGVNILIQHSRG
jgi:putative Mn2+ efflux pump MntP